MLIDEVAERVVNEVRGLGVMVVDECMGVKYTYVRVYGEGGESLGIAFTDCGELEHHEFVEGVSVDSLTDLVRSPKVYYKVWGAALLNALSQYLIFRAGLKVFRELVIGRDVLDIIPLNEVSTAVVVGFVGPVVRGLRERGVKVMVTERGLRRACVGDAYVDTALPRLARGAELAVITGASIVNDSIDAALEAVRDVPIKAVVGPTAQYVPYQEVMRRYGIDYVASIHVTSPDRAADVVKHGGGTKQIMRYSRKYVVVT